MAMSSPFIIALTALDESVLRARARSSTSAHRDVIRARIVLAAADGATNTEIAAEVGVHVDTVRKWRRRFVAAGLPGLEDLPRSGRRRVFTPVQVAEVKALACTLPAETGPPLSRWSSADLATEAIIRGLAETISAATVRRWLAADAIKPWQHCFRPTTSTRFATPFVACCWRARIHRPRSWRPRFADLSTTD